MTHYIDLDVDGNILGLYTDEVGYVTPPVSSIPISQAELDVLRFGFDKYKYVGGVPVERPEVALNAARASKLAEIDAMERREQLSRGVREGLLSTFVVLAGMSGVTEPQLYAANIAYKKMKDFDAQIVQLRAQL